MLGRSLMRGLLAERKMNYDQTLSLPSAERDIVGVVLWAFLMIGLCLQSQAGVPQRLATVVKPGPCAVGQRA